MLRALINLFRSEDPLAEIGEDFSRMFRVTYDMALTAGRIFFGTERDAQAKTNLYSIDVEVNRLVRSIRKRLVAHLSIQGNEQDVPHSLALMSLVKDVERLGDYSKNLAEVIDLYSGPFPDDENTRELEEIRAGVERIFGQSLEVFTEFDHERALALIQEGRTLTRRCDALLHSVARSPYDAAMTTAFVLGSRYYKRFAAHVLNVLSAVVMPLHKLDYYDEHATTLRRDEGA
ncbi:MAG: PhoU domain-containing protein [Thermoanaerobaculia bacterium]